MQCHECKNAMRQMIESPQILCAADLVSEKSAWARASARLV